MKQREMVKVVVMTEGKREIKLFLHPSAECFLTARLRCKGMKYYLGPKSKTEESSILHHAYGNEQECKTGKFRKFAGMCTFNGEGGHLIIGQEEGMVISKGNEKVAYIPRNEPFKEHLYWLEFSHFWISFSSRGKKVAFLFEMRLHSRWHCPTQLA
jgi:hypothetical protein